MTSFEVSIFHYFVFFVCLILVVIETVFSDMVTFGGPDRDCVLLGMVLELIACVLLAVPSCKNLLFVICTVLCISNSVTLLISCHIIKKKKKS